MTATELFRLNGDSSGSPLIETARRLHRVFRDLGVAYTVIGGVAVARAGAIRTTHDLDVLTTRDGWARLRQTAGDQFDTEPEAARDRETGVSIDVLFPGNDWEMLIPLADPATVSEYDEELGACFMPLDRLIELKCAVYLCKRRDDGIEVAAKDLADVVALIEHNDSRVSPAMTDRFHPRLRREVNRIARRIRRSHHERRR